MIVIADTSPINYLVQIGEIVLPRLYSGQILVPPSVYNELKHPRAPDAVRRWINQPPEWLRVPHDHKCGRLHGHSFRIRVYASGPVGPR
jgi:predicted nucleic acid-binding protein